MGVLGIILKLRELLKANQLDAESIRQLQQRRFRALLRHAAAHSPFYREKYRGIDLETCGIADLPVVTKKEMMANFDGFVTDPALKRSEIRVWLESKNNLGRMYRKRFIPFQTSGTTGENALVIYDRKALDWVHAAFIARHALEKEPTLWQQLKIFLEYLFIRRARVATIVMTGGPYPAYTAAMFAPPFHNLFVSQKIFSLRDPIGNIIAGLNEFQPDSLVSYPSLLGVLAREQLAGRLNIRFDRELSTLATGSEPLSEKTKRLAKEVWEKDVQDTYGSSECFVMARSCGKFDRMHVMSDLCIMEVVDRNYAPVPNGQVGEKVLLTNLFNTVQPFIRYEISDVTGYSTSPCSCGLPFPTLLPVEGRTDDIFYIDRPGGGYEAVHPYLFLGPIVELDEVKEYQLVQTARNEVTFSYVPADGSDDIDRKVRDVMLDGLAKASLAGRIEMKFRRCGEIERDARSGKLRQIRSLVGAPPDLDRPHFEH